MAAKTYQTNEDLFVELSKDPEFQKEQRQQEPYYDLAREVFNWRKTRNLTQQRLAELSRTHQSRISKIEAAELDIQLSTLIAIAEALKTRVEIKLVAFDEFEETDYQQIAQRVVSTFTAQSSPQSYEPIETVGQFLFKVAVQS